MLVSMFHFGGFHSTAQHVGNKPMFMLLVIDDLDDPEAYPGLEKKKR